METRILENSINKICSLLAIGFGDAGAEVLLGGLARILVHVTSCDHAPHAAGTTSRSTRLCP